MSVLILVKTVALSKRGVLNGDYLEWALLLSQSRCERNIKRETKYQIHMTRKMA